MGCFRLASFFALTLAVSLMLGAFPRDAWAGVCGNNAGCVVPGDVKKNAVRARHRKDEAGMNFVSEGDVQEEISGSPKVYASVAVDAPAAGTVIVNASITAQALPNLDNPNSAFHGRGTVECALTEGGSAISDGNRSRFFMPVDWDEDVEYMTGSITRGFAPSGKGSFTIALSCRAVPGSGNSTSLKLLRVRGPSISAAYYANRN